VAQLAVFHSAQYKRTRRNKETRTFYVERAVKEVLSAFLSHLRPFYAIYKRADGDGSALEMDMFAKYPRTPSDSTPNTPFPQPRRRIRCKMCRQELATREHMVDHGQVGPATPAAGYMLSPAVSRRPSTGEAIAISRRGSVGVATEGVPLSRRPSGSAEATRRPSFGAALTAMTPITPAETPPVSAEPSASERDRRPSTSESNPPRRKSFGSNPFGGLSMTPMATPPLATPERRPSGQGSAGSGTRPRRRSLLGLGDGDVDQQTKAVDGLSMSAVESDEEDGESPGSSNVNGTVNGDTMVTDTPSTTSPSGLPTPPLASPQELAAQIHPNLAALRSSPLLSALSSSSPLGMTPLKAGGGTPGVKQRTMSINSASPPLLMPNAKCSGYFVEPVSAFRKCRTY
jgi:dual specificity phosphatase 12